MTIKEVSEKFGLSQDTLRYYERAGLIPAVSRTPGGIRNYQEEDLRWVELALCMRSAGLPIEALAEYVRLTQLGDDTMTERLRLLQTQRDALLEHQRQIAGALARLDYKIERYESTVKTGKLDWNEE